jgi:5-methylcytosine-specific restriction endonuclease McrA
MEAIYEFDSKRFRLGTLCIHGHAWPGTQQSLRRIHATASDCAGCTGRKNSSWLLSFIDYEAMGWPANQTLGKLCKKEHKWEGQNASLRRWGKCVECERLRKIEQSQSAPRKTERRWIPELKGLPAAERKLRYRRRMRESFISQGLTSTGAQVKNPARQAVALADKEQRTLWTAIRHAGRCPSVAKLVMNEQRQYWQDHPEAKKEHDRQWRQAIWWLNYQIRPELRLYIRQKSKRRKALERGSVGIQVKGCQITKRFAEFGHRCAYCGATGDLHIEHVNPISKGGTHVLSNVVPACQPCNYSKRAKDAETWYRAQPFFCKKRWAKILKVMGAGKGSPQQLALL